jgi:hypothetical protein
MKTVVTTIPDRNRSIEDIEAIVRAIESEYGTISDDNHELSYSGTELYFDSKDDDFKQSIQLFCSQFQDVTVT